MRNRNPGAPDAATALKTLTFRAVICTAASMHNGRLQDLNQLNQLSQNNTQRVRT